MLCTSSHLEVISSQATSCTTDACRYCPSYGPPTVDQSAPGIDAPLTTEPFGATHSFPRGSTYTNRCVSCMLRPSGSQSAITSPLNRPKFAAIAGSPRRNSAPKPNRDYAGCSRGIKAAEYNRLQALPPRHPMSDVTRILSQIEEGDFAATEQLLPLVYDELRRLAASKLVQESPGKTLQPTALVHEAFLRLVEPENQPKWETRGHFFAAAAEAMRRILVESARRKKRLKRGGDRQREMFDEAALAAPAED